MKRNYEDIELIDLCGDTPSPQGSPHVSKIVSEEVSLSDSDAAVGIDLTVSSPHDLPGLRRCRSPSSSSLPEELSHSFLAGGNKDPSIWSSASTLFPVPVTSKAAKKLGSYAIIEP